MTQVATTSERFGIEHGWRVAVQVPKGCEDTVLGGVLSQADLQYCDYNAVTFSTAAGQQTFRSLGSGRNRQTPSVVNVPSVEISFFVAGSNTELERVLEKIYATHPYEEPVIYVDGVARATHVRGTDENNPNCFWNLNDAQWVPTDLR